MKNKNSDSDKSKGVKIVVTGGAGFIGSHIVDALVASNKYEVHVIDNLSNGKLENVNKKAVFHKADIRKLAEISPILKGAKYVFHEAALPRVQFSIEHPDETNEVNVTGTLNVLIAARDAGVKRLVYAASSSAYGDQPSLPLIENMEAMPKSPYGLQKYIGELYLKLFTEVYGMETVSLQFFKLLKECKALTITGDGTHTRDFTSVHDVSRANLLAMTSKKVGKGEVINIGAGHNYSVNEVAKMIGGKAVHIAPRLEPHDTLADNSLAKKLLGWTPEWTLEDGIKELKKLN